MLAGRYEVIEQLGSGWESEVYLIREAATGIERAAKLFYPQRNPHNKVARRIARKLHKLRDCPGLVQYITHEQITVRRMPISVLVSEYLSGTRLSQMVEHLPGKRLHYFEGLHLLHALCVAMEPIHEHREFHGDLHLGNILVERRGIGFEVKLIDLFEDGRGARLSIQDDVIDLVKIFYDVTGGQKHYARHPEVVRRVCKGLKRSLILKQYRTAGQMRRYIESLRWDEL